MLYLVCEVPLPTDAIQVQSHFCCLFDMIVQITCFGSRLVILQVHQWLSSVPSSPTADLCG